MRTIKNHQEFMALSSSNALVLEGLAPDVLESIREQEAKMEAIHSEEVSPWLQNGRDLAQ